MDENEWMKTKLKDVWVSPQHVFGTLFHYLPMLATCHLLFTMWETKVCGEFGIDLFVISLKTPLAEDCIKVPLKSYKFLREEIFRNFGNFFAVRRPLKIVLLSATPKSDPKSVKKCMKLRKSIPLKPNFCPGRLRK